MKTKSFTKILAFLVTMMVAVSMMSVPVWAAGQAYDFAVTKDDFGIAYGNVTAENSFNATEVAGGSGTQLDLAGFKAAYLAKAARYRGIATMSYLTANGETEFDMYFSNSILRITSNAQFYKRNEKTETYPSETHAFLLKGENPKTYTFDNIRKRGAADTVDENERVTAVSFFLQGLANVNIPADANVEFTVTFNDNTTKTLTTPKMSADDKRFVFFGVQAPANRYITSMTLNHAVWCVMDDFGVLTDIVEPITPKAPVFSADAAGENVIEKLLDISSSNIYVTIPANAQATGKLILAIYDTNGLLDVNVVNESAAQAMVTIPSGKTVTKIKMFVWDSLTGLSPLEGKAVTINQ